MKQILILTAVMFFAAKLFAEEKLNAAQLSLEPAKSIDVNINASRHNMIYDEPPGSKYYGSTMRFANSNDMRASATVSCDPGMLYHVDPSIDLGMIHVMQGSGGQPKIIFNSDSITKYFPRDIPNFNFSNPPDLNLAIPNSDGSMQLTPDDSYQLNLPKFNLQIPAPEHLVPKLNLIPGVPK